MADKPQPQVKQPEKKSEEAKAPEEKKQRTGFFTQAHPAVVEEIVGKTGTRGGITQVRARILDGPDKNKVLRRNIKGSIRIKDILMLRETEIEARSLTQTKKGRK